MVDRADTTKERLAALSRAYSKATEYIRELEETIADKNTDLAVALARAEKAEREEARKAHLEIMKLREVLRSIGAEVSETRDEAISAADAITAIYNILTPTGSGEEREGKP